MSKTETYQCQSYVDDNSEIQDCTCGKCGYQQTINRWKEAYEDILKVCKKYPEFKNKYESYFSDIHDMEMKAKDHLTLIEWYEKYGLKISHEYKPYTFNYFKLGDGYGGFHYYADAQKEKDAGSGRYISWPDDDRQPLNEWLFGIQFPTGAYIFGQDYPTELFQKFFDELASYKPDFSDRHNNCLYWKLENAKDIYNDFYKIMEKYKKLNAEDRKQREIKAMKEKLAKLEQS